MVRVQGGSGYRLRGWLPIVQRARAYHADLGIGQALEGADMNNKQRKWLLAVALVVTLVLTYTQITIFVIQPIGMMPEGKTLIVTRIGATKFIDSPDAMCERAQGGVSLLCRAAAGATVATEAKILWRLPYSSWLYLISTGGKSYDN